MRHYSSLNSIMTIHRMSEVETVVFELLRHADASVFGWSMQC